MRAPVLILIALLSFACNNDESPTAPGGPPNDPFARAVLFGRTLDANGTPVPEVTLSISTGSGTTAHLTTSGPDGQFEFEAVTPGAYALTFRMKDGQAQNGGGVRLFSGPNQHDVLVGSCRLPYGTVRDAETGRAIAGATVSIFSRTTTTDANGHYQIDFGCGAVEGSTIIMSAAHPDYQPAQTLTRASFLCTCAYDFLLTRR